MIGRRPVEPIMPAYRFGQMTLRLALRTACRMWEAGLEHLPDHGGCLVASNHQSYLDPPVLAAAIPHRQVFFLAKRELFAIPLLGPYLRWSGCIQVDRGAGDRRAMDQAVEFLGRGRVVGIYPEGTRSRDGRLRSGRTGVAALALRAGTPVVPAAVFHTGLAARRRMLPGGPPPGIRFGAPLSFGRDDEPSRDRLLEVRDRIMSAIADLLEQGPPFRTGPRKEEP